jgi:hypothetical protein
MMNAIQSCSFFIDGRHNMPREFDT